MYIKNFFDKSYCVNVILLVTIIILLAWLLIPAIDFVSAKAIIPFTNLLPYHGKLIPYVISTSILIGCALLSLISFKKFKGRIISQRIVIGGLSVSFTLLLVWWYERFFYKKWYFLTFFDTNIALVDILLFTLLIISVSIAVLASSQPKRLEDSANSEHGVDIEESLLTDKPISVKDEDNLHRLPFAVKFANKITKLETSDGARSLAVTAPWGNGKTSFLNLVKNELIDRRFIIVDIIPWNLNPDKSITAHFFEEITKKFGGIDHSIAGFLKRYSRMLESVHLGIFSDLSSNISLPDLAKSISHAMVEKGIKVVVVFDDIDRLSSSEIEEVFRIIRGSANFTNFIFLSAFDKRYVQQALQNSNAAFNEHYIEKFFEMEFPLPAIKKERIEKIILDNSHWLSVKDRKEFEDYITRNPSWIGKQPSYAPLTNLRTIYRWLNSLRYKYDILREECRITDLADLEMINLLFPEVYTLLATDHETFFECEDYQNTYKLWDETMKVSSDSNFVKRLTQKRKRNLLTYCKEELKIGDVKLRILSDILDRLVPKYRYHGEPKGFSNPAYTQRYFDGILDQSDIPQSEFDAMIEGNKPYKEFINNDTNEQYTHALYLLCIEAKPKNRKQLDYLLDMIFYASSHYNRFGISYYKINELLYPFVSSKELSKEEQRKMFRTLLTKYKFPYTVFTSLLPSPYSDRSGWLDIFTKSELDEIVAELFEKAVSEGYAFDDISHLYSMAKVKVKNENEDSYECKNERIQSAYKKVLAEASIKNPAYLIYTKHPEDKEYYPSPDFIQLWGNWNSFESYVKESALLEGIPCESLLALDEFREFIEKWNCNSKRPIPYIFSNIKMSKK